MESKEQRSLESTSAKDEREQKLEASYMNSLQSIFDEVKEKDHIGGDMKEMGLTTLLEIHYPTRNDLPKEGWEFIARAGEFADHPLFANIVELLVRSDLNSATEFIERMNENWAFKLPNIIGIINNLDAQMENFYGDDLDMTDSEKNYAEFNAEQKIIDELRLKIERLEIAKNYLSRMANWHAKRQNIIAKTNDVRSEIKNRGKINLDG